MITPFLPMLATAAQPFDSSEHYFEVKWDGVRALAAIENGQWQLWGRDRADYSTRYPELATALLRCPSGTVVDGEIVILRDGRADLTALQRRHQLGDRRKIDWASRHDPVRYIIFDLLYHQGRALWDQPLFRRRCLLLDLLPDWSEPPLVFSEAMTGMGKDFFDRVVAQGHEGVVAKHASSRYLPGRRSAAWRKLKPTQVVPCVVVGFTPAPGGGFHSLLVATPREGKLRYVGQLTCGFSERVKDQLALRLARKVRNKPVVVCPHRATWVEPEIYCQVQFLQWTEHGRLRGASFRGLIEEPVTC